MSLRQGTITKTVFAGDYRRLLREELRSRQARNPAYSLRAYARFLGLGKSTLSAVLMGQRHLSPKSATKVADRLGLSPAQTRRLLEEIAEPSWTTSPGQGYTQLEQDQFALVADPFHYALLCLAELPDSPGDVAWFAERAGIEPREAKTALTRLERLGLVEKKAGRVRPTRGRLTTTTDIPSEVVRDHHRRVLSLASRALEEVDVGARDFSTITVRCDARRLSEIKTRLRIFRRKLARLMEEESRGADDVYTVAIQLFPLALSRRKR